MGATSRDAMHEVSDELAEAMLAEAGPDVESADLENLLSHVESEIDAAEQRRLWSLRSMSTPVRQALIGAGLSVGMLAVFLFTPRHDMHAYPAGRLLMEVLALVIGLGVTLRVATRPLHATPTPPLVRYSLAAGTFILCAVLALLAPAHGDLTHQPHEGASLLATTLPCLVFGSAFGLPAIGALWVLDRSPLHNAAFGGLVGALASALALQLHCPITGVGHRILAHLLTSLLMAAVALLAGHVVRRRNASSRP